MYICLECILSPLLVNAYPQPASPAFEITGSSGATFDLVEKMSAPTLVGPSPVAADPPLIPHDKDHVTAGTYGKVPVTTGLPNCLLGVPEYQSQLNGTGEDPHSCLSTRIIS